MDIRQLRADARTVLRSGAHRSVTWQFILLAEIPVVIYVAYYLLDGYAAQVPGGFSNQHQLAVLAGAASILYSISYVCSFAVQLLEMGYQCFLLRLCRGQHGSRSDLFLAFRHLGRFLVLLIVSNVLVFLWSLLFLIPGIIAGYRYSMAVYLLMDHPDLSPMDAIRLSCELTNGYKMDLFFLDLSFWYFYLLLYLGIGVSYLDLLPFFPDNISLLTLYLIGEVLLLVGYLLWLPHATAAKLEAYLFLTGEHTPRPDDGL
jgi:uncharacterized membrane protein